MKDVKVWDRLDCSDHGTVGFKILRRGSRIKIRIIILGFKRRLWPLQGSAWRKPMGDSTGEERGPGDLVDLQT